MVSKKALVLWFGELGKNDIPEVGGKCANLGEMTNAGIPIPPGFAVTAWAYKKFITDTGIAEKMFSLLDGVNVHNSDELNSATGKVRELMERTKMPKDIEEAIKKAYREFNRKLKLEDTWVAVRSSATAEDLPDASFAGQQETFLNVRGEEQLLESVRKCWSSLFTPRATFYRAEKGFSHSTVLLSVAVQKMVNSRVAGVMFTLHPATGDRSKIMIEGTWGLGESVVSGSVTPDNFLIEKSNLKIVESKMATKTEEMLRDTKKGLNVHLPVPKERQTVPCLNEGEIVKLAELAKAIEAHYGNKAQDIEWAIDRDLKFPENVFIVQARPETVWNRAPAGGATTAQASSEVTSARKVVCHGLPASPGMVVGVAKIIPDVKQISRVVQGDLLVTKMTTPDWVPAMRKACAIITEDGGTTAHAAIVSRELGIPCIVGTGNAMSVLKDGGTYTVDARSGVVYEGRIEKEKAAPSLTESTARVVGETFIPCGTKVLMNLGVPEKIEDYAKLPFDGIGLMRVEFIIADYVKAHPNWIIEQNRTQEYIDKMTEGISMVARAIAPRPMVVRFSDFKTNEYRELPGGEKHEPQEANPMIGWRGVSRYISPNFEQAFRLECRAILKCRKEFGLKNVWVMLPFVRTTWEVEKCVEIMKSEGLERNRDFKVWLMAEVPAMAMIPEEFAKLPVDGASIGSNDMTQLVLGADRDSDILGNMGYFDERDPAVLRALKNVIEGFVKAGKTCSICGQAPSVYPEITEFLVKCGITSVSVNPDTVVQTRKLVASVEQKVMLEKLAALSDRKQQP